MYKQTDRTAWIFLLDTGMVVNWSKYCFVLYCTLYYQLRFCQQICFQRWSFPTGLWFVKSVCFQISVKHYRCSHCLHCTIWRRSPTWQWDNDQRVSIVLTWPCHARRELTSYMTQSLPSGCIATFGTMETPHKALTRTTVHPFNTLEV